MSIPCQLPSRILLPFSSLWFRSVLPRFPEAVLDDKKLLALLMRCVAL